MRFLLLFTAVLAGSSCTVIEQPSGLVARYTTDWKQVVTQDDRARLAGWRTSFVAALDSARRAGHAAEMAKEGALLDPDAAVGPSRIPDGLYRCRIIKIGTKGEGNLAYIAYPAFYCRVKAERDLQRFNKFGGSQRYVGLLFPADAVRQVFLGTLVLGDETRALQYGQDAMRDVAGFVERIEPARWRLILPKPHFESQFDVIELVPAAAGATG